MPDNKTPPPPSARAAGREALARQLDAGRIGQARFDDRTARAATRGAQSEIQKNMRHRLKRAAARHAAGKIGDDAYAQLQRDIRALGAGEITIEEFTRRQSAIHDALPREWSPGQGGRP